MEGNQFYKLGRFSKWQPLRHSSANATNLVIVRNRVCRKSGKKPHAKARRRKVSELTIFAPLRDKFHAAIFLLLRFLNYLAVLFTEKSLNGYHLESLPNL